VRDELFEIDDVEDLYLAIAQLRSADAALPYTLLFSSRAEIESLLEDAEPEDHERFSRPDVRFLYKERGRVLVYPSGEPARKDTRVFH
jgi:hypothetical protein